MIVFNTSGNTAFSPNGWLFLSWQLIIDGEKARGEWLAFWCGDVRCVEWRSRMKIFRFGKKNRPGTLSVEFSVKKMTAKTPKPQAWRLTGEAITAREEISSILPATAIDCNLWLKEICTKLLPHTVGWENLFLRQIIKLPKISESQKKKIEALAADHEKEKASRRICRHCQGSARIIDEFSYSCRNCGNCLNLGWKGGEQ